jgi:hypothetical protein
VWRPKQADTGRWWRVEVLDADVGEAVGAPLSCGKVYRRKLDLNIQTHTTTHT